MQTATKFTAFIDTDNGEFITIGVNESDLVGEICTGTDDDGQDIFEPEYAMGSTVAMPEISTGIAQDDDNKHDGIEAIARGILADAGWHIVGTWETADNAYYVEVERA